MHAELIAMPAAPVSFDRRVVASPDVLYRTVGDEAVILHLGTELYLGLDPIGARIWTVLHDSPSIGAAFDLLRREYDVEPEVLRRDLMELIDELLAQSLVTLEEAGS
jgi:hypothetical protein